MKTHERLQKIETGINRARFVRGQHGVDLSDHKAGIMELNKAYFYKPQDSHRMIAVCDRYIDYWTRKYHELLLAIPAHQMAVSIIRRLVDDAPGAKMQAEEYLQTFKA